MDEARSAEVLLARAMVGEEELDALLEGLSVKKMGERLRSGSKSVDDALEGGLVDGRVVGIWGEGSEVS
jgi:RecA/RadA recombinase